MPTITKLTRKPRPKKHNKASDIYANVYNTTRWRKLRQQALERDMYLCRDCMDEGRITPAVEVHHIDEVSNGQNIEEILELGFCDVDGLVSLCQSCHHRRHNEKK